MNRSSIFSGCIECCLEQTSHISQDYLTIITFFTLPTDCLIVK